MDASALKFDELLGYGLVRKGTSDKLVDVACAECGHHDAPKQCDGLMPKGQRLTCDKPLCTRCAVHDPTKDDTDYCPSCAKGQGFLLNVHA